MADLPSYVKVITTGFGETFDPGVERTEMERGPPMQYLRSTSVMKELTVTLQFERRADAESFEDWYFDVINRIGYFNMRHPRTREILSVRFKSGDIGTLTPVTGGFGITTRQVTVEYMR